MSREVCKKLGCIRLVWRTGNFSYSNYCWEHDPQVVEAVANKNPNQEEKSDALDS